MLRICSICNVDYKFLALAVNLEYNLNSTLFISVIRGISLRKYMTVEWLSLWHLGRRTFGYGESLGLKIKKKEFLILQNKYKKFY